MHLTIAKVLTVHSGSSVVYIAEKLWPKHYELGLFHTLPGYTLEYNKALLSSSAP